MEAIQIYLLISRVIATARLKMTVGSKPITSLFTVLNSATVTASWCPLSNKLGEISSLCRGHIKDKGDESVWIGPFVMDGDVFVFFLCLHSLKCPTMLACVCLAIHFRIPQNVCVLKYMRLKYSRGKLGLGKSQNIKSSVWFANIACMLTRLNIIALMIMVS